MKSARRPFQILLRTFMQLFGKHPTREPRFRVLPLHKITFEMRVGVDVVQLRVANLSTQGIGLIWNRGIMDPLQKFEGKLNIAGKEFVATVETRHQTHQFLGCLFIDPGSRLSQEIREYLKLEMHAIKLQRIEKNKNKADQRGEIYWYTDKKRSEIYFIRNHDRVVYFHLTFLGFYVEGGDREHIRTGKVSSNVGGHSEKGEELEVPIAVTPANKFDIDVQISEESLRLGGRFVESADNVPEQFRRELNDLISAQLQK